MRSRIPEKQVAPQAKSVNVSVKMPPDMVAALKVAGFQRRSLGDENSGLSQLVREAVAEWLEREINDRSSLTLRL